MKLGPAVSLCKCPITQDSFIHQAQGQLPFLFVQRDLADAGAGVDIVAQQSFGSLRAHSAIRAGASLGNQLLLAQIFDLRRAITSRQTWF
jgi:hypothetical protein